MGFDLFIYLKLMMCPETGMPFYFGPNGNKVYASPQVVVPAHLKNYLQGRGRHYFAYLRFLDYSETTEVALEEFLENYPEWQELVKDEDYDDYWTEEDHNKFAELLKYLHSLNYPFSLSWSY